ncbi:MAG: TnpV protein [Lachnospiraceae bacterium]|nr:TnpV protein [Lachnospiraceae bacterium]
MEGTILTYHERADGMMYPNLQMEEERVSMENLGRFAVRAMEYLKENHKERYQTLLMFGKLAEKMQEVEEEAYHMMEALENDYLKKNPPKNQESTMEMWHLREQARMQAEETVMKEVVMKFH